MKKPPSAAGAIRMTPSAPIPAWRSHRALTCASLTDRVPSRSGSRMKSFSVPCPFKNGTPPIVIFPSLLARGAGPGGTSGAQGESSQPGYRVGSTGIDAMHPRIAPEPGTLPADETTGQPHGLGDRDVQFREPVEYGQHLGITEGPRRRDAITETDRSQSSDFVQEPGGDHAADALLQPPVQRHRVAVQADEQRVVPGRPRNGKSRREGPAGDDHDLEGPDQASPVGRLDRCSRGRIQVS